MENKLEQLLNSLIKRWRLPFGDEKIHSFEIIYVTWKIRNIVAKRWRWQVNMHYSIIELCSKSSWLWQFVCDREHRFIDKKNYEGTRLDKRLKNPYADYDGVNTEYEWTTSLDYQYRLIEASLKDESELEEFLLQNIKVDAND